MDFLWKFFGGAFALIALYLIVVNGNQVNTILKSFAASSSQVFGTLQGRGSATGLGTL